MGLGGGGSSSTSYGTGSSGGSGDSQSSSSSYPTLYNWSRTLTPWQQSGQQAAVPWLQSRAQQGFTSQEERDLWGGIRGEIAASGDLASKNLSRQIASSGMSPNSPAAAGGYADLAADRMSTTSKAALDFAKMKVGAKDSAIGQMLTSLYSNAPVAVGNTLLSNSQSHQSNWGNNQTTQSQGGGGK